MEGVIHKLVNDHHIDHEHELIVLSRINHVEVDDAVALDVVNEEVVDGVLVCGSYTLPPKGIGFWRVLRWGLVIGQA